MPGVITPCGGGYTTVQDEGSDLTQRGILDFAGAGVTATDDAGGLRTLVTIPGVAGAGMVALYDSTLSVAAASFDFTSISQSYAHLYMVGFLRGTAASSTTWLRVNNVSTANYDYEHLTVAGVATVGAGEGRAQTAASIAEAPSSTSGAANWSAMECTIPNYTQAPHRHHGLAFSFFQLSDVTGNLGLRYAGWGFRNTEAAAITRLTVYPDAGNWAADSRLTLYGLAGI